MTEPVWVRFSLGAAGMARAMPKSATFTWPGRRDEDVAGLDVAVDDAVAVGEAERGGDVGGDLGGALGVRAARRLRRISGERCARRRTPSR